MFCCLKNLALFHEKKSKSKMKHQFFFNSTQSIHPSSSQLNSVCWRPWIDKKKFLFLRQSIHHCLEDIRCRAWSIALQWSLTLSVNFKCYSTKSILASENSILQWITSFHWVTGCPHQTHFSVTVFNNYSVLYRLCNDLAFTWALRM